MAHVSLFAKGVGAISVLMAGLLAPPIASGASNTSDASDTSDRAIIAVRVYEVGARNPELTAGLAKSVTRLLDSVDMGTDILFVDCAEPDACGTPAPGTFVLRLMPGHHPAETRQCGEATGGASGRRGVLMTVFRGCVDATRRELRASAISQQGIAFALLSLSESDILAAIVIHELIHLVLPEEGHGKGLFKATLDARDWLEIAGGWPHLEPALVSRLGRALASEPLTPTVITASAAAAAVEISAGSR